MEVAMVELPFGANDVRWPRDAGGHHESFHLAASAPDRKLGIWIKYVITSPRGHSGPPFGELWAVILDGDTPSHRVAKRTVPPAEVEIEPAGSILRLGAATVSATAAAGEIPAADGLPSAAWSLRYEGDEPPILHYPGPGWYTAPLPRMKVLTVQPCLRIHGTVRVGDQELSVDGWRGSAGHTWGRNRAFDHAHASCNSFDGRDDVRFEGVAGRFGLGPLTSPHLGYAHLRIGRTTYPFARKRTLLHAGHYAFPRFSFLLLGPDRYRLSGTIWAPREEFVGLASFDPDGGPADALATKFGRGELLLERKVVGRWEEVQRLTSEQFELEFLLRDVDHGVPVIGGNPFEELSL